MGVKQLQVQLLSNLKVKVVGKCNISEFSFFKSMSDFVVIDDTNTV